MTSTLAPTPVDPISSAEPAGLTTSDRAVLTRALGVLRAARQSAANADQTVAAKGRQQLSTIVGYLTGYMDAKGLGSASGLGALFPPDTAPDLGAALDQLESVLEAATQTVRFDLGIGDVVVAIGEAVVAVGHALQALGI